MRPHCTHLESHTFGEPPDGHHASIRFIKINASEQKKFKKYMNFKDKIEDVKYILNFL